MGIKDNLVMRSFSSMGVSDATLKLVEADLREA
jgi:hypothetical protein